MSRDQQTAQLEGKEDQHAASESHEDPFLQGMPPGLQQRVIAIQPGDVETLAALLKIHRGLYDRQILILAARTPHLGNSMVQRAIARSQQREVQDTAPGMLGDQVREGGAFELDAGSPRQAATPAEVAGATGSANRASALRPDEVHRGGEFDPFGRDPAPQAGASGPAITTGTDAAGLTQAAEPAWVTGARAYHASHAHQVTEFNELTAGACTSGDQEIDPRLVSNWQASQGIAADGRVGPQTLASARALTSKRPNRAAVKATPAREGAPAVAAMHEKARAFNAARPDLVQEFNDLTSYLCFDFATNELVPSDVAKWQMKHGEPADGMVTVDTVAVAKTSKVKGLEGEG